MIPECELELDYGTLGGRYTTVEGLVEAILDNFKKNNPFMGDSTDKSTISKCYDFYERLENFKSLKENWTLIIDDPLDNSFL